MRWARGTLWLVALGFVAVSVMTPLMSERIFAKWFELRTSFCSRRCRSSRRPVRHAAPGAEGPADPDRQLRLAPFAGAIALFTLGFYGLAYSFFPYVVPEKITVWEAAASDASLMIMFVGACLVLPMIAGYTVLSYWIFRGKAGALRYD